MEVAARVTNIIYQLVEEHIRHPIITKHFKDEHNLRQLNMCRNFKILKKCRSKLECLIFEMLFIRQKKPKLNTQSGSIQVELFV